MQIELDNLQRLQDIFQKLLSGYHLSSDDFGLYHELQDNESDYEQLFSALGYNLQSDSRGYYYFLPETQFLSRPTQTMALIIFVLIEWLADQGKDPVATISKSSLDLPQLCQGLFEKHAHMLKEGGVHSIDDLEKSFNNYFVKYGFAVISGAMLRFRPPVHRFLDICAEVGAYIEKKEVDS